VSLSSDVASLRAGLLDALLSTVFPTACPACGALLAQPSMGPLCRPCWFSLPRHAAPLCRCGFPLQAPGLELCGRCRRAQQGFARGHSIGPYRGALRIVIHELKYRGRRQAARLLAEILASEPRTALILREAQALVPVPLHSLRLRERGFNQSLLIARALARQAGVPVWPATLRRVKATPPQTGLTAAARRLNMAGAFECRERLAGQIVVLVDDVFTTGATLRSCAGALKRAGAGEVRVLTLARVV
jgi:ComF family protein